MATIEEVKDQVKHMTAGSKFLGRAEIKALPKILWEDERLEKMVQGYYGKGFGVLVATNKRLIFVDKGLMGLRVEDFPYDKISSIQYETGFIYGSITIYTSGNKAEISKINKAEAPAFGDFVRARITKVSNHASHPPSAATDVTQQLENLAALKEKGILTEEEFTAKKKQVLGI